MEQIIYPNKEIIIIIIIINHWLAACFYEVKNSNLY